ncbi:MAG: hypothetical protein ACT4O2_05490 [Beijerinckiaceae bacterium]
MKISQSIDGQAIGDEVPGAHTKRLREIYIALARGPACGRRTTAPLAARAPMA